MRADQFCKTAGDLISGKRSDQHGPDLKLAFQRTADLWSAYLGKRIEARDVPMMMVLLKVTRSTEGEYNADDYIDICGYAALAGQIESGENDTGYE